MKKTNVITFPKKSARGEPFEDFRVKIEKQKEHYINNVVDQHSSALLANIALSGFDIENDEFMKDFAFTVEALRSNLYRNMGLKHTFHKTLDDMIEVIETEELDEDESMDLTFGSSIDEDDTDT